MHQSASEEGFTLLELMVVLGIIGILSSIAIPNYQAYAARARQTEAKLLLASIYTLEYAFQIENSTFSTCLSGLGFDHLQKTYYYTIGFASSAMTCGNGTQDCHLLNPYAAIPVVCVAGAFPAGGLFMATAAIEGAPLSHARFTAGAPTSISTNTFTVAAMGSISSMGATVADIWTINESRQLSNIKSGI